MQRIAAVVEPNLRYCGRPGLVPAQAAVPNESNTQKLWPWAPHTHAVLGEGEALPAPWALDRIAPAGKAREV